MQPARFFTPIQPISAAVETINGAYHMLDLAPKGRDEEALQFPQSWVRYHDQYEG